MKLCKDCKHKRNSWLIWPFSLGSKFWKCVAPQGQENDPVTGKNKMCYIYCSTHRSGAVGTIDDDLPFCCGPSGKFFEPKD